MTAKQDSDAYPSEAPAEGSRTQVSRAEPRTNAFPVLPRSEVAFSVAFWPQAQATCAWPALYSSLDLLRQKAASLAALTRMALL